MHKDLSLDHQYPCKKGVWLCEPVIMALRDSTGEKSWRLTGQPIGTPCPQSCLFSNHKVGATEEKITNDNSDLQTLVHNLHACTHKYPQKWNVNRTVWILKMPVSEREKCLASNTNLTNFCQNKCDWVEVDLINRQCPFFFTAFLLLLEFLQCMFAHY